MFTRMCRSNFVLGVVLCSHGTPNGTGLGSGSHKIVICHGPPLLQMVPFCGAHSDGASVFSDALKCASLVCVCVPQGAGHLAFQILKEATVAGPEKKVQTTINRLPFFRVLLWEASRNASPGPGPKDAEARFDCL